MMVIQMILLSGLVAVAIAHGQMTEPRPRGALKTNGDISKVGTIDNNAPQDFFAHFPAGDKSVTPGAGKEYQREVGGPSYSPFDPFRKSFNWRAGVCGDREDVRPQPHLKGGEYYYDGKIVREYKSGDVVDFAASIQAHHNGFFEFFICNLDSCPDDDISRSCFQNGHCQQLLRAPNSKCDSKKSKDCGPVDRNYPGRWYLPCSKDFRAADLVDVYGGSQGSMKYQIPDDLVCKHCVVLWYWASSNSCQAVGVEEYFTGPDAPEWGTCEGQAGAIGGYVRAQPPCGGSQFTEEYYQCADVAVRGAVGTKSDKDTDSTTAPTTTVASTTAATATATTTTTATSPSMVTYASEEDYPGNRACRCLGGRPTCWESLAKATDDVCKSGKSFTGQSDECKEMCCDYCNDLKRRGGSIGECRMGVIKKLCDL